MTAIDLQPGEEKIVADALTNALTRPFCLATAVAAVEHE